MCKADYVRCVRGIMSHGRRPGVPEPASLPVLKITFTCIFAGYGFTVVMCPKQFDILLFWYIILITDELSQGCQMPPSPPTGCAAPPPRSGHCRTLPGQQLLRCQRFDPGQIRDAATGRGRTDPGQPGRARSRTLPALVLSSSGSPPTKWSGGIDSAKARTARSPQAHRSGNGFSATAESQSTRSEVRRAGPAGSRPTGRDGSPTHHPTGAIPASKKTPLNGGTSRREPESGMLRERYEQIRERALGRTAIDIGSEVVMRWGMRSWMEAGCRAEVAPAAPASPAGRPQPDQGFRQIVAVWASVLVGQAERSYGGPREA